MRHVIGTIGLRPFLIPQSVMQQLDYLGVRGEGFIRRLADVKSLDDWPYVWESEADKRAVQGDWEIASALYYLAQRVIVRPTPLKRRLYSETVRAYDKADHVVPLEKVRIPFEHHVIAGLLQVPEPRIAGEQVPLIVMVPGVTATKEEYHGFARTFLRRRYAVLRIDNPGYGETRGILTYETRDIAGAAAMSVSRDPRIDADQVHLMGNSMGGFWALHGAVEHEFASVIGMSAPFMPHRFVRRIPTPYQQALQYMAGDQSPEENFKLIERFSLEKKIEAITEPVRLFHGGRDDVVPYTEMYDMARRLDTNIVATMYPTEYHVCLGMVDTMLADSLDWMDDPQRRLKQARRRRARLRHTSTAQRLGAPLMIHAPHSLTQTAARLEGK